MYDLVQQHIGSSASAGRDFGASPGMLVGVPSRGLLPYIIVPEGYYALVTTNGAEIEYEPGNKVWPSGFYPCAPWTKISHLINKGHVLFDTPCKGCKTKDNVTVQIDVNTTFRIMGDPARNESPNLVTKFVHEVTPRGLQQQLRDAIDEAVRMLARSMKHQEVYGLRSITIMADGTVINSTDENAFANSLLNTRPQVAVADAKAAGATIDTSEVVTNADGSIQMVPVQATAEQGDMDSEDGDNPENKALLQGGHLAKDVDAAGRAMVKGEWATGRVLQVLNKQFMPQGVEVVDVMITNVELPSEIVSKMYSKTMVISENAQEIMTQQYDMQELKFNEELKKAAQTFKEEREQEHQDGQMRKNEAQVRLNNLKAEANKNVELLRQDNRVLMAQLQADAELEITKLEQERNQIVTELSTKSSSLAAGIRAEADLYCTQKKAEAGLTVEKNDAKSMETVSNAEGIIAPLLKEYNIHEQNLRKLGVFNALSKNKDMVIAPSGTSADTQTLMLVDQILESASKNGKATTSRSEMLSELMLMRAGGNIAMNPATGATILASSGGK